MRDACVTATLLDINPVGINAVHDASNFSNRLPPRGRGAVANVDNRFAEHARECYDDGWGTCDAAPTPLHTQLAIDHARSIISYNQSPDVPFDRSINPYRGCEHGCVYCFARPSHAYLGLSPGLDFESKLFYKPNAVELLRKELAHARYQCAPIALGINTDAYQPVERKLGLTRAILQCLAEHRHPVSIVTKSSLIERDIDILSGMAKQNLVSIAISLTTLDRTLARAMEPRATAPARRVQTIRTLADAGIPVGVLIAPVIPVLTDPELETLLQTARTAQALWAGYVMLRLPRELVEIFHAWLHATAPGKAKHVINAIRETRGGKDNDARFGARMRGQGVYADIIARRFKVAYARLKFPGEMRNLDTHLFHAPKSNGRQLELF
ncbi:MAG: PA0069 family radical SAM protein [Gammaproteobacteria bacterium]|nr:PA0069 family radical SAM protein [Gammaproteobacteria bacterium]